MKRYVLIFCGIVISALVFKTLSLAGYQNLGSAISGGMTFLVGALSGIRPCARPAQRT